jgi:hypothetical protein
MGHQTPDDLDWTVRHFVYRYWVDHAAPPSAATTASAMGVTADEAQAAYERLERRHALLLDPETRAIRMANPLSAVPTPFRVEVGGRAYWANCAWDALGIPAMLGTDARVAATCAEDGAPIGLAVVGGRVVGDEGALVHLLLPFREWYDDQVFT